jgi:hypothetical protein
MALVLLLKAESYHYVTIVNVYLESYGSCMTVFPGTRHKNRADTWLLANKMF